jgi:hypothetical protein
VQGFEAIGSGAAEVRLRIFSFNLAEESLALAQRCEPIPVQFYVVADCVLQDRFGRVKFDGLLTADGRHIVAILIGTDGERIRSVYAVANADKLAAIAPDDLKTPPPPQASPSEIGSLAPR